MTLGKRQRNRKLTTVCLVFCSVIQSTDGGCFFEVFFFFDCAAKSFLHNIKRLLRDRVNVSSTMLVIAFDFALLCRARTSPLKGL